MGRRRRRIGGGAICKEGGIGEIEEVVIIRGSGFRGLKDGPEDWQSNNIDDSCIYRTICVYTMCEVRFQLSGGVVLQ